MAGARRCVECGAQLRLRSTLCPLCGAEEPHGSPAQTSRPVSNETVVGADDYQADIRKLREELRRLREAEAS